MGVFKQSVFGDHNPFNGTFLIIPTTTVLSKAGAPGTAAEGTSVVLTGDVSTLEFTFPNPTGKQ